MIGRVLLGDAEAEHNFELLLLSRVMPEVIECAWTTAAEGDGDNFFSASRLEEGDL